MRKINLESLYIPSENYRWKDQLPIDRFWSSVKIRDTLECWEWLGAKNIKGYGIFGVDSKYVSTHRLSWMLENGEIPEGMYVCHKCDNPSCVNPNHLFLGTNQDNIQDMYDKGRRVAHRGENVANSKLTNIDAAEIRNGYYPRTLKKQRQLAKLYGVSISVIQRIVYNNSYVLE